MISRERINWLASLVHLLSLLSQPYGFISRSGWGEVLERKKSVSVHSSSSFHLYAGTTQFAVGELDSPGIFLFDFLLAPLSPYAAMS